MGFKNYSTFNETQREQLFSFVDNMAGVYREAASYESISDQMNKFFQYWKRYHNEYIDEKLAELQVKLNDLYDEMWELEYEMAADSESGSQDSEAAA